MLAIACARLCSGESSRLQHRQYGVLAGFWAIVREQYAFSNMDGTHAPLTIDENAEADEPSCLLVTASCLVASEDNRLC